MRVTRRVAVSVAFCNALWLALCISFKHVVAPAIVDTVGPAVA